VETSSCWLSNQENWLGGGLLADIRNRWQRYSWTLQQDGYAVWVSCRRWFIVVDDSPQSSSSRMQLSRCEANCPSASLILSSVCGDADWSVSSKNEENIPNIACKLISTILCDWHCLVVCQHNSWANFILRQHRKRTIVVYVHAIGAVDSICIVLLEIYSGVSLPKIIKFGWDFTKPYQFNINQMKMCSFLGHSVYRRSDRKL